MEPQSQLSLMNNEGMFNILIQNLIIYGSHHKKRIQRKGIETNCRQ